MNERPVIFTVTEDGRIYTEDKRVREEKRKWETVNDVYRSMSMITETLNQEGYAVLFEVD